MTSTLIGFAVLAVSLALGLASAAWFSAANPGERLPYSARPVHNPMGAIVLRAVGVGISIFAVQFTQPQFGYWSVLFVLIVIALPLVITRAHNRRVLGEA